MTQRTNFVGELLASLVVFLVAVPLCLGIAIASGAPPSAGLLSGIVGGLIVGAFSGCPLQVTGPAAGLIALVWELGQKHGPDGLAAAIILGGALQLLIGAAGLGQWFRAVSPAVVQGMLTGIGAVIVLGQAHVMLDLTPGAGAFANATALPAAAAKALSEPLHGRAALLGLCAVGFVLLWGRLARGRLALVPGTLLGVAGATALAHGLGWPVRFVPVPDGFLRSLELPGLETFALTAEPGIWIAGLTVAFVASAETLLTAAAVDRMSPGHRTAYDREVLAQGLGNMLAGAFGGLPVTGVIARSAANVQAGARTRWSTVMHGAWILLFVALLPAVLRLIPVASLAAILVLTGIKLLDPRGARFFWRRGGWDFAEFAVTAALVVGRDLLSGIVAGFVVALARIVWTFSHLDAAERTDRSGWRLVLHGAGHFLLLPRVARLLEAAPSEGPARVDASGVIYADHAFLELLDGWVKARRALGQEVSVDWGGEPPTNARLRAASVVA